MNSIPSSPCACPEALVNVLIGELISTIDLSLVTKATCYQTERLMKSIGVLTRSSRRHKVQPSAKQVILCKGVWVRGAFMAPRAHGLSIEGNHHGAFASNYESTSTLVFS